MPNPCQLPDKDDSLSDRVIGDQIRLLAINQLDERLERYRLAQPKLEQQMLKSLRDYGQLSPVVVCQLDGQTVLVDGFKRLRAARTLKGHEQLFGRFLASDEQGAKAAIFNLNRITGRPVELEEAWIIYALVIEVGLQLDSLSKMNTWLRFEGRSQLQACDRGPLQPGFAKLQQEATLLIEANDDFVKELQLP